MERIEPTEKELRSVCLSFRHDFGLMAAGEQAQLMWQAREWLRAWQKEIEFRAKESRA